MFDALLARLDPQPDVAAERYNQIRWRLVYLFRWRRLADAEDLADEVLNRTARKVAAGEVGANVTAYILGVARLVALEAHQRETRRERLLAEYVRRATGPTGSESERERALQCLDRCLAALPDERREELLDYYAGEDAARIDTRRRLAERLGIGQAALRNRMLRLRQRLEASVADCLTDAKGTPPDTPGDEER